MGEPSTSPTGPDITVMLVDAHAVTRVGLRTILEAGAAVRVVGECGSAAEALDLAAAVRPTLAVVDLLTDNATAFGLIKDLPAHSPDTRALVYAPAQPPHTVKHLLAIGARGYACKSDPPERLVEAVRRVAAGKTYVDPDTAGDLIEDLSRPRRPGTPANSDPGPADRVSALSGCELEVFHMMGHGQTTADIAAALHRSLKTIETYRSRIKKKLRLRSPQEMAQLAWQFVHGVGVRAGPATANR